jgi:hypothetical protein
MRLPTNSLALVAPSLVGGILRTWLALPRRRVVQRRSWRTQPDEVGLNALRHVRRVYYFRNSARLAQLGGGVEARSVQTAVDFDAGQLGSIQVGARSALVALAV